MENKIESYYGSTRVSNSLLSGMLNPRYIHLRKTRPELFEDEDRSFFRFGAAVDCMLTDPSRWDEEFLVVNVNKPYGLLGKFVHCLPKGIENRDAPIEMYETAYSKSGYKMPINWVIDKFWSSPEAVEYYRYTKNPPEGKTIISKDEYEGVLRAKDAILCNEYTYPYFFNTSVHTELRHQVPIYFEYKGVECKALLDGVLINHRDQWIQPFDLKTTGKSVYDFPESYLTYGYYRQAAFYDYAINTPYSGDIYDLICDGYEVRPFKFIVIESKISSVAPAVIYTTSKEDRVAGLKGGYTKDGKFLKGIDHLLEDYLWHTSTDKWDMPRALVESQGELPLSVFG